MKSKKISKITPWVSSPGYYEKSHKETIKEEKYEKDNPRCCVVRCKLFKEVEKLKRRISKLENNTLF